MILHRRTSAGAAALALLLSLTGPALAQDSGDGQPEQEQQDPGAMALEGAQRLMRALEGILQMIPQYGMPRVEENGDIVIPRLDEPGNEDEKQDQPPAEGEGGMGQTEI